MLVNEVRLKILTDFEQIVLQQIKKIPVGKITTYGLLARAINVPDSARAVGNALHKNPCAPVIPCHRIIKSDGSIGGYGGGVPNKIKLLKKEGVEFSSVGQIKNFDKILYEF